MLLLRQSDKDSEFSLLPPFDSIQALHGLEDARPHCGGPSALLSLPIKMLISSRDTLTNTPKNNA